jgi:hypothetical protein
VKEGKPMAGQRHLNAKRRMRNPACITNIAAKSENDKRVTVRKLTRALSRNRVC